MKILDLEFVTKLDDFLASFPNVSCTRWGSSGKHNAKVGGAPNSMHLVWSAVDLIFDLDIDVRPALQKAIDLKFGGIEWDTTNQHLHLDNRSKPWHVVKTNGDSTPLDQWLLMMRGSEPV